jgi:hypothetical protein
MAGSGSYLIHLTVFPLSSEHAIFDGIGGYMSYNQQLIVLVFPEYRVTGERTECVRQLLFLHKHMPDVKLEAL